MRYVTSDGLNKGRRLEGIQLLRGAAALGVVLTHVVTRSLLYQHDAFHESYFRLNDGDQWKGGDIGVDIFFVISGFIIMVVHRGDLGKSDAYIDFLIKRVKRVVPLYWILTTMALAFFLLAPQLTANSKSAINIPWIVCSYLFIPTSISGDNNSPVVGVGWTLDYEMMFYVVFAFLMRFRQSTFVVLITVIFTAMVLGGTLLQPHNIYGKFLSDWLLMDFVGGVWIAYLMFNARKLSTSTAVLIVISSLSMIFFTFRFSVPEVGPMRFLIWGLPSIALVNGMIYLRMQDGVFKTFILTLGNASYSIYLSQVFTIPLWTIAVSKAFRSMSFDIQVFLILLLTTFSGVLIWYFIERGMNRRLNIFLYPMRGKE